MEVVLIDMFIVPEAVKESFLEQTKVARAVAQTLPGFVEGFLYEMQGTGSQFNFLTVAVWEDEAAFASAKEAVAAEYQKRRFSPLETLKTLNVEMTRAVYKRMRY